MTLQQITNLTPEELRIKCAEAEGFAPSVKFPKFWTKKENPEFVSDFYSMDGLPQIPQLTLDTAHRREMELTEIEYARFSNILSKWSVKDNQSVTRDLRDYLSADAITRSRAILAAKLGV